MTSLAGIDPRTGLPVGEPIAATSLKQLDRLLSAANRDRAVCASSPASTRIRWLLSIAEALESQRSALVDAGDRETALGMSRLNGELDRTIAQIRLFIDVLTDGSFLNVIIDDADPQAWPAPRPELRRGLRALGPVGVWAASNFPFAFGVVGGDTVSALAAGCPVIVKAHPSQPVLSEMIGSAVAAGLEHAGAPEGAFSLVHGMDAGIGLVTDPRLQGAAFTGSLGGGRALFDLACGRPDPIPFFGELGSINPVFITPLAAEDRPREIADGLVASATLGVGQFCTKPGLVFVPEGSEIPRLVIDAFIGSAPGAMLNASMRDSFTLGAQERASISGVSVFESAEPAPADGAWVVPRVAVSSLATYLAHREHFTEECFGPLTILVEYPEPDALIDAARTIPGCLTATIHGQDDVADAQLCAQLVDVLQDIAGRLIWNGWPTGVAVAWGMQHGGPYPASTAPTSTSVGAMAIQRFLRPVTYQGFLASLVPPHLRDDHLRGIVRRNGAGGLYGAGDLLDV
jgi:acyl-CoA reductase-like NAD-dependent aldehyde dehydrogenase